MQQRLPSILDRPLAFAHRGARAHAPENTMEAFELALRLGATGLESDVWLTADDVAVLDHDGKLRRGLRSRPFSQLRRDELPEHVPTVDELFTFVAPRADIALSIDLKDAAAAPAVLEAAHRHGVAERLWLCHHQLDVLTQLRPTDDVVRLVDSTRLTSIAEGPERRAARLADLGVDAINMRHDDWSGGLVALFHRFDRITFAWDLQFEHLLRPAIRMGLDGVFSDHVDVMVDALRVELGDS